MPDLIQMAKAEYESLSKQLEAKEKEVAELKEKIRPINIYLKEVGVIEKETRNREKGR